MSLTRRTFLRSTALGGLTISAGLPARQVAANDLLAARLPLEYSDATGLVGMTDREHVRKRPGMYIGDTGTRGMHYMVGELLDNSIDHAMAGQARTIDIAIHQDGSCTVSDDGPGIPTEVDLDLSERCGRTMTALEGSMTVLRYGGKFKQAYRICAGLHDMGVKAVNFLSDYCHVEVRRNGQIWQHRYRQGIPVGPARQVGVCEDHGTRIRFLPDPQIFRRTKWEPARLRESIEEQAVLNAGVTIQLRIEATNQTESFCFPRGLADWITQITRDAGNPLAPVLHVRSRQEEGEVEVAFVFHRGQGESINSYMNCHRTSLGGCHAVGLTSAIARCLKSYGNCHGLSRGTGGCRGDPRPRARLRHCD